MPGLVVDRSIDADKVVATLDRLALERGAPAFVRFDHGPEFIAAAVAAWCRFNGVGTVFIDPGSPWQNAWIESFNGRLRYGWRRIRAELADAYGQTVNKKVDPLDHG